MRKQNRHASKCTAGRLASGLAVGDRVLIEGAGYGRIEQIDQELVRASVRLDVGGTVKWFRLMLMAFMPSESEIYGEIVEVDGRKIVKPGLTQGIQDRWSHEAREKACVYKTPVCEIHHCESPPDCRGEVYQFRRRGMGENRSK